MWGCSFILIKRSLVAFDPIQVASLRIVIAALAFLPFVPAQLQKVRRSHWPKLVLVGLLGSALPAFCYAIAQTQISSAVAGILNSLTPLWTLTIGWIVFKFSRRGSQLLGVVVGIIGASILILAGSSGSSSANMWFSLFIVIGTMCYGTSGNLVKAKLGGLSSITISVLAFVVWGPLAMIILWSSDAWVVIKTHPSASASLLAVTVLALVGTVLCSMLYFKLVKRTEPLFASLVSYLIPIVAVVLGLWDGEQLGLSQFCGFILIVSGIYLTRGVKRRVRTAV